MKKKLITTISCLLAAVFGLGMFSGCDLIETDSRADMEQVVAEVNIGGDADALESMFNTIFGEYTLSSSVTDSLSKIITTENIYKRDLFAYFINYGYSLVSGGSTYAEAFDSLMDNLVTNKIIVQYAMIYYLSEGEIVVDRDSLSPDVLENLDDYGYETVEGTDGIRVKKDLTVSGYLEAKNQEGLSGYAQTIASIGYFLTEDEKNFAEYQLRLSINNAIDSNEEAIINAESNSSSDSSSDRATPTGANETDENYYPKTETGELDYQVYTGSNYDQDLGEYETIEGSTPVTRKKAYNQFINSLIRNYLKDESESPTDITALNYYSLELKTYYEQMMINKFSDTLTLNMSNQREKNDLNKEYSLLLEAQTGSAEDGSSSDFTTTMDSMSDSSFVLYSPSSGYGFVYNILLPFSSMQSAYLTSVQNSGTDADYYAARNAMLKNVRGTDQRSSWFNGSEDYSYDASETGTAGVDYFKSDNFTNSSYLFFEDSYTKNDGIDRYAGKYPYNGSVSDDDGDGVYTLIPNKVSVEQLLDEFNDYLNFIDGDLTLAGDGAFGTDGYDTDFYTRSASDFISSSLSDGFAYDYEKMIYYKGSIAVGGVENGLKNTTAADLLKEGSESYNAISVFNELMFAYSTDTGCLNTYLGYSIAAEGYSTSYVTEFEYAAQQAVANGTGTVYVVATEYGWHIMYVSMTLPAGNVYGAEGFDYDQRNEEGTFSYYFYQAMKDTVTTNYVDEINTRVMELLNVDANVTIYQSRYEDFRSIA